MKSRTAFDSEKNEYELQVGELLSKTNFSEVYACLITSESANISLPFLEAVAKYDLATDDTEVRDEASAYESMVKIFGEDLGWILLGFVSLEECDGKAVLVTERANTDLKKHFDISKNLPNLEKKISPGEFKQRLDMFTYICWLVNIFHQHNIPVQDLKPQNILVKDYIPYFIDFSFDVQTSGLGKYDKKLAISQRYVPLEAMLRTLEKRFSNLTLDVYGLVCVLIELLTNSRIDYYLAVSKNDSAKRAKLVDSLRTSPGLVAFIDLLLKSESEKKSFEPLTANQSLLWLSNSFLHYLDQDGIRDLDTAFLGSGLIFKELSVEHIASKFLGALGLGLKMSEDPNQPWEVNWSENQIRTIENS